MSPFTAPVSLTGPAPGIARDTYGRPLLPPKPGATPIPYTRVTTLAKSLDDQTGLTKWKLRLVAYGMAQRPDLIAAAASTSPDDKRAMLEIAEAALEHAGSGSAARIGTALHAFTERHDRGEPLGVVPAEYVNDLNAYVRLVDSVGMRMLAIEQFVVSHSLRTAGTFDRLVEIDGQVYIADLKTSQTIDYPHAFALQLAVYAHSLPWSFEQMCTTPWERIPSQTHGLIIHAPSGQGRADLYWLDLTAGWRAVGLAEKVREFRRARSLIKPYALPNQPTLDLSGAASSLTESGDLEITEAIDPIIVAIDRARTVDALGMVWQVYQTQWTDVHTVRAVARKTVLQTATR